MVTDITVYNKHYNSTTRLDEWQITYLYGVWWYGGKSVAISGNGLVTDSAYKIRIYPTPENEASYSETFTAGKWRLQNGDVIAKGTLTTPLPKNITAEHFTVTMWSDIRFGGLPHWRAEGK